MFLPTIDSIIRESIRFSSELTKKGLDEELSYDARVEFCQKIALDYLQKRRAIRYNVLGYIKHESETIKIVMENIKKNDLPF